MGLMRPFDAEKHPRGWHGRFAGGSIGRGSNAHALRVRRGIPEQAKRDHAVVPHIAGQSIMHKYGNVQASGTDGD